MMRALFAILLLGCVVGCSTTQSPGSGKMLRYPDRTLADWQPDKAVAEAERDIAAGTLKIYISGTIAAFAPGISSEQSSLVRVFPKAGLGGFAHMDQCVRRCAAENKRKVVSVRWL